ncbi:molybdenum cofactor cytidylyltransferase [Tenacibaculum mesophilum]|uniref:Nucleotidyltransferase family protein n=1 Tax=Tenacibaculum mesophilum TaxID=104268 RepID=A0ABN5T7Y3_9FLAO|nr:nucleotidyltransferase family protein [Tenacibaculum mesophilum]AZJ33468.1 nucleotidyltransferase family protein [Tenacibaculum mesophilum]QFS28709.1 NTP transferase domain-containing protein [Tenacibaculum mesophilum]SHF60313.1 molybdenum cofactor cytidylyltransferase [Tenacibaculum mesophilum]
MQKTAILILAAGSASRMGKIKQLLPYKNTTLLEWTIEQAQKSTIKDVFCVLGANKNVIEKQLSTKTVEVIYNPNYKNGLSTSIVEGINLLQKHCFDNALIMLADQPHVTSEYLNSLIKVSKKNPSKIITSNYQGSVGVPAVFPKEYFNKLLNLKGDKGAKNFLLQHDDNIFKVNSSLNLLDIDTPEDYQYLLKQ